MGRALPAVSETRPIPREDEEDVHPVDDVEQRAQRPARDVGAEEDAPPQREVLRLDAQPEPGVPVVERRSGR